MLLNNYLKIYQAPTNEACFI